MFSFHYLLELFRVPNTNYEFEGIKLMKKIFKKVKQNVF